MNLSLINGISNIIRVIFSCKKCRCSSKCMDINIDISNESDIIETFDNNNNNNNNNI